MTEAPAADRGAELAERIAEAAARGTPLAIAGGGSKAFYGHAVAGEPLDVGGHRGIVTYEPTELVLTARAGTSLAAVEATLAEGGQMLPFEPPCFAPGATLGGAVASGLAGPRRAYAGAVRDFVLGTRVIDGRGTMLRFGGEVMKNVAGYDLSRLMAGALGTLGVVAEVSLKVLPRPEREATRVIECPAAAVYDTVAAWQAAGAPVSATAWEDGRLAVRLSGAASAVAAAEAHIGGEAAEDAEGYWAALRDHRLPFFGAPAERLWRVSLPPGAEALPAGLGEALLEWSGQLIWLRGSAGTDAVREAAAARGGHATLFRGARDGEEVFHPLPAGVAALHRRLKATMDPAGILNPGRLYPGL